MAIDTQTNGLCGMFVVARNVAGQKCLKLHIMFTALAFD